MAWEIRSWAERLVRSLAMIGTRITAAKNPKKIAGIKISGSIVRSMLRLGLCPIADTDAPGRGFGRKRGRRKRRKRKRRALEGRALKSQGVELALSRGPRSGRPGRAAAAANARVLNGPASAVRRRRNGRTILRR